MSSAAEPSSEESLFSPSLISPAVTEQLPQEYSIRPLQRSDYDNGFLDVLRVLTQVGDISKPDFETRFDEMKAGSGGYHVLVILNGERKIVGTGALIVERKLWVSCTRALSKWLGGRSMLAISLLMSHATASIN
jgi:glucosamine-phosphate N-acetyltransferase